MKTNTSLHIILILFGITNLFAQIVSDEAHEIIDYSINQINNEQFPCISENEYKSLETEVLNNQKKLNLDKTLNKSSAQTLFSWPLKPSVNLKDCSYYRVSNYVDQNTNAGVVSDFNCGTNTYDGHRGTDIMVWPFNFYKMDNDLVEIIAAASGIIIAKNDGEYDRNCTQSTAISNYVIIQHPDGSQALYLHMKKASVTTKSVGDAVSVGEYLGVVGSSGSSTDPHLHFEVLSAGNNLIDPYSGTCNLLNANSWWVNQKPYSEPAIVKASVHTADITFPACPIADDPNESDTFAIPFQGTGLPEGYANFAIFFRDEVVGLTADLKILNPNGSIYESWTYTPPGDYNLRTRWYTKLLPTTPGIYTFQTTYNDLTCSSTFKIENTLGIPVIKEESLVNIYPNPSKGTFMVEANGFDLLNSKIQVFNALGANVYKSRLNNPKSQINLNLSSGIYYYRITNNEGAEAHGKLLIEN